MYSKGKFDVGESKWLPVILVGFTLFLACGYLFTALNTEKKEKPKAEQVATTSCESKDQPNFTCYKNQLTQITNQQDPEAAFALVKKRYNSSSFVKSQCHQLTHVIGRAAYARYDNIADTFAHGDQFCWSGYYHGAIEELTNEKGYDYTLKNANTICSVFSTKEKYSFAHYNCVHGLGHGFMFVTENKFFDALKACDNIIDEWERSSCWGGVFMQNIMNVQGPDAGEAEGYEYLKQSEPMYPCTAVETKYKQQCYLMQTSYVLPIVNYDFNKVFGLCAQAPAEYQPICYQSLGRDASGQSVSNVGKTSTTCLLGSDYVAQSNCIIGAAKDFVSYYHSDVQASRLCASLPPDLSTVCNETVKSYYASF